MHDEAAPSEQHARRAKLAFFDCQCGEVRPGVLLSGDTVARARHVLSKHNVTHVVNATAFSSCEYFRAVSPGEAASDGGPALVYTSLWLQDSPGEDLLCVLYDVFDFLAEARAAGGAALVHCTQGVSRSAALVTGWLMHTERLGFEEALREVRRARGVAAPNLGFACQLLQWGKRVRAPVENARLYRVQPHSLADPTRLVARQVSRQQGVPLGASLDARGAYVLHTAPAVYVWTGLACAPALATAAERFAGQLSRYEGAPSSVRVSHGAEPEALLQALGLEAPPRPDCRLAAYDSELELLASGRRSDAALRSGVGAQDAGEPPVAPSHVRRRSLPAMTVPWESAPSPRISLPAARSATAPSSPPEEAQDALAEQRDGTRCMLWELPSLERLFVFDFDDLDTSSCFVLLAPGGRLHVWLGTVYTARLAPGDTPQTVAARAVEALRTVGAPLPDTPPCVELEGQESPSFLEHFD